MKKYIIKITRRKKVRRGSIEVEVLRATVYLPSDKMAIDTAIQLHNAIPMTPSKTKFKIKGTVSVMVLDEEKGIILDGDRDIWENGERVVGEKNMYRSILYSHIV